MKKTTLLIAVITVLSANVAISQWNSSGNNIFNTNTGNVGIGNNSPATLLHVQKNMIEPMVTVQNLGGSGGATYTMIDNASGANWKFKATLSGGFKIRDHANSLDVIVIEPNSSANSIYISSSGSVGIGTASPNNSALVDITTENKGFLLPRLTLNQRNTITSPPDGLLIFNLTTGCLDYYLGGSWKSFCGVTEPDFQCGMKLKDLRDGQMYNTVKIGTQCWLAENLNYNTGSSYCYDNDPENCEIFGRLYNWETMMNGASGSESVPSGVQGVCPEGWHIPSAGEFSILSDYIGSPDGGKMKQAGYQYWQSPNTGATNESGFTALPAGARTEGLFDFLGTNTYFWTTREINENTGWNLYLLHSYAYLQGYIGYKGNSHVSVRCLKD